MGQGKSSESQLDQLKQASRYVDKMYDQLQKRLARYETSVHKMDLKNRKRAKSTMKSQEKQYKQALKQLKKMYKDNEKSMTKQEKQAEKLLYKNRVRDLKKLQRESSRVFSNISDDIEDAFDDASSSLDDFADKLAGLSLGISLNDLGENIQDTTKSNIELKNSIMKYTGMSRQELDELNDSMTETLKELKYKFSNTEWLEVVEELASSGIKDTEVLTSLAGDVLKQQAVNGSTIDDLAGMIEMAQQTELNNLSVWGDWIKALTSNENLAVTQDSLTTVFNDMYESVWKSVNGDAQKFNERMSSIMAVTSAIEEQWGDTTSLFEALDQIKSADPTQMADLLEQYKYLGSDVVLGIKSAMQSGQIDEAMKQLVFGVSNSLNQYAGTSMEQLIKNQFKDANLDSIMKLNIQDFNQDLEIALNAIKEAETQDMVNEALDNQITSIAKSISNWFTDTSLGKVLGSASESTGVDMTDLLLINSFAGNPVGKLFGKGFSAIKGFLGFGSGAKASTGLLSKAGTSAMGWMSQAGAGITSTLSTLATGISTSVGSMLFGGISGGAGILSGLFDIVKSFKEEDEERKSSKRWSGGAKIGMVGSGAAAGAAIGSVVPVVGTATGALVGAGLGGLGALFKGNDVGSWLKDKWDNVTSWFTGDNSIDNATNSTKQLGDMAKQTSRVSKDGFRVMETSLKSLDRTAKSTASSYSKSLSNIADSSVSINDSGQSTSSSSGSSNTKKRVWWNPFTWINGSHKTGLDRVPFDGYIAELHKDEAVLTKEQAKEWRSNESGSSFAGYDATGWFSKISSKAKSQYQANLDKFWSMQQQAMTTGSGAGGYTGLGNISGNTQATAFKSMSNTEFINWLGGVARDDYKTHKVLPSLTVAQGILESGWGKSGLSQKANNLFGIKAGGSWKGDVYNARTAEYTSSGSKYYINDGFRKYANAETSVADHGALLNKPRYSKVLEATHYTQATQAVKNAGYATDPNYPSQLNKMIERYNLNQFDNNLPAYAQGTPWVPNDQVALLHKGEMVVPAEHNPLNKVIRSSRETEETNSGTTVVSDNSDVVNALKWAVSRIERKLDELDKRTTNQSVSYHMADRSNRADEVKKVFAF